MKLQIRLATILAITFLLGLTVVALRLHGQSGPDLLPGMELQVHTQAVIQPRTLQPGDRISAILSAPLMREDQVMIPAGTAAILEVQTVRAAWGEESSLSLVLSEVVYRGQSIYLESSPWQVEAPESHALEKIGGGAAIGGMLGGWRGARRGALIGLGIALLTERQTEIQPGEELSFTLLGPVYLTALRI
jgi:hypothetical protein